MGVNTSIKVFAGPFYTNVFGKHIRSPKLNGGVERAHRTHTEEFYEVTDSTFDLDELREKLLEWEHVYNTVRPHQPASSA